MRALTIILSLSIAHTAHANPTTQSCLGNIDTLLTCPAGAQRMGNECRVREPKRGQAPGEHWSGSKRQGPSVFFRRDGKTVSFAASYKDHKKTGRVYRFDAQGRLASYADVVNDKYNGVNVQCLPNGRIQYISYFKDDRVVGISRSWKTSDGSFSYAMDRDAQGRSIPAKVTPDMKQRPDHLCQPKRCDLTAAPDLSGVPTK